MSSLTSPLLPPPLPTPPPPLPMVVVVVIHVFHVPVMHCSNDSPNPQPTQRPSLFWTTSFGYTTNKHCSWSSIFLLCRSSYLEFFTSPPAKSNNPLHIQVTT